MMFTPDFVLQLVVSISSAYAVYAGIKESLATVMERATSAKKLAEDAHGRIDDILQKG